MVSKGGNGARLDEHFKTLLLLLLETLGDQEVSFTMTDTALAIQCYR